MSIMAMSDPRNSSNNSSNSNNGNASFGGMNGLTNLNNAFAFDPLATNKTADTISSSMFMLHNHQEEQDKRPSSPVTDGLPFTFTPAVVARTPRRKNEPMPADFSPTAKDVVCGLRGKQALRHVGNRRFRATIAANSVKYSQAPTKLDKSLVVISVVDSIRGGGGSFVRKNGKNGGWVDIGDQLTREKVGHALRDHINSCNNNNNSSMVSSTTSDNKSAARKAKSIRSKSNMNKTPSLRALLDSTRCTSTTPPPSMSFQQQQSSFCPSPTTVTATATTPELSGLWSLALPEANTEPTTTATSLSLATQVFDEESSSSFDPFDPFCMEPLAIFPSSGTPNMATPSSVHPHDINNNNNNDVTDELDLDDDLFRVFDL